ncbi:hypothetical protein [Paraburkholderia acidisoli]|uniref:Uncharacterized protein n=1 Tax=Paraburkholderia acidisoli TaxID=2571748 RepID=A0A7Z2JFV0_9BURK|nr:hypothetical protein [Paraburkholderia acidisoli]QGZ63832.1 hypothetical protein FAZ98_18945 [Paraburkholderia acidisoli]
MKQTVTGLFKSYDEALHAQAALLQRGFAASEIDLPAQNEGVLAGIERLVTSFFSTTGDVRQTTAEQQGEATPPLGESVRIGVHVDDEVHAELAAETLRAEHALEVARRGAPWTWPAASTDHPAVPDAQREHSALDELGLGDIADAMRRRAHAAATPPTEATASTVTPAATPVVDTINPVDPLNEAEATVLTAASAPGAGAVMGVHHVEVVDAPVVEAPVVNVPAAPEAKAPAQGVAPQIPNEFLEFEEASSEPHPEPHEAPASPAASQTQRQATGQSADQATTPAPGQPPRTLH